MIDKSLIQRIIKDYSISELDEVISYLIDIKEDKIRIELISKFEQESKIKQFEKVSEMISNDYDQYIGAPN